MSNKNVSIERQREMGLRRSNYSTEAPLAVQARPPAPQRYQGPPPAQTPITLDVSPTAVTSVEMRTSAVDRAKGFLIASVPRTAAFALSVSLASIVLADVSFLVALVILFSTFSVVELISYVFTLAISAEGTGHYEAVQKWKVIREEQRQRWKHYQGGQ